MDAPRYSSGERGGKWNERRDKRETKPCHGSIRRRRTADRIQRSGETAPLVLASLIGKPDRFSSLQSKFVEACRKTRFSLAHSRNRMNKGFGTVDCLWDHPRIPVPTPMAPADRSVASAASVRSDLALDFVLLGASVPPKKQNGGLLERKGLLATAASRHFVSSPPDWPPSLNAL